MRLFVSSLISLSSSLVLCLSCVTVSYCLSFFYCNSSILFLFVCFLCCSLRFFVSSLISLSLSVVPSRSCVTAVQLYFDRPLCFVNSLRLCLLSLLFFAFLCQFFNFFVFVSRSFSFLRHCRPIVFRSSSVFRQFSTSLLAFSVILFVSLSVLNFVCLCQSFFLFLA